MDGSPKFPGPYDDWLDNTWVGDRVPIAIRNAAVAFNEIDELDLGVWSWECREIKLNEAGAAIGDDVWLERHCSVVDDAGGIRRDALEKTSWLVDSR